MITSRRANENDLNDIVVIFQRALLEINIKDYTEEQVKTWAANSKNKSLWLQMIKNRYFIVAQELSTIVGFASLSEEGFVDSFYVHPDYVGKGIAHKLYDDIEAYAIKLGLDTIYLNMTSTALPFFEKKGFTDAKPYSFEIGDIKLTNYRMHKSLKKGSNKLF